jgi:hypothetical protein
MTRLRREVAYPLVLIWAFIGIAVRQSGTPAVMIVAILAAVAVLAFLVFDRMTNSRKQPELAGV